MANADKGHFPPTNDDGSFKDVDMQFNRFILKPDGKTIVDTKTGTSYDLSNIGSGGSSVLSDGDSDGLYEQDKDGFDAPVVKQKQTRYAPTEVSGNYTTSGESVIYADSSGGALTVTLASADATDGNVVEIYDVGESAGTNAITIDTEGTESINPGGKSSIDISLNGGFVKLRCRAGNWFTDRNRQSNQAEVSSVSASEGLIKDSATDPTSDGEVRRNGTVPKIQGQGMIAPLGNRPEYELDGNSPDTMSTASTSYTYTLANSYDVVYVSLRIADQASVNSQFDLTVNGLTSGYTYHDHSGTKTSGAAQFDRIGFVNADTTAIQQFRVGGTGTSAGNLKNGFGDTGGAAAHIGYNTNIGTTLTDITISRADSFTIENIVVLGRDL